MRWTLRNRIAITFAFLTAFILAGIFFSIYVLNRWYTRQDFFESLKVRASIAAQVQLEQDEVSQKIWEEFRQQHLKTLPDEKEFFLQYQGSHISMEVWSAVVGNATPEEVYNKGLITFRRDSLAGVVLKYEDNQGDFAVVISAVDRNGEQKLVRLGRTLFSIWLFYLFFVFFVGRWYASRVLFPLRALTDEISAINTNNLGRRIEITRLRKDELSELAENFNKMLGRIQHSLEIQQNFISNASHQLRNPLTAILGELEIMGDGDYSVAEYRDAYHRIEKETGRLNVLVKRLLQIVQAPQMMREADELVRVDDLLLDLKEEYGRQGLGKLNIDFSSFPSESRLMVVQGNPDLLKILFGNVIENAFKYSDIQEVSLRIEILDSWLKIQVKDNGPGIPADEQAHVFEPFFRGRNVRHIAGYGVGLAMVARILEIHGGKVELTSGSEGSVFEIWLPVADF